MDRILVDTNIVLDLLAKRENFIVEAQELIAILRNPFGDIIKKYYAPEKGIVIGKTSNPINMSGGRIIHLGIIENNN